MEFIFGLKLAKKKYDVFSYNSSSSSWILILIPVFSQQQHDSFHWLCLCLFVLSNFIWKLWKNFVFCLLNLETKICFFDMVLGTQNVDIHFSIHLIRLNVISTFVWKNASLTNSFFLFFFGGWKSEWSWIEGMMKNLNFSQHKCVQYAFNNILKTKTNVWLLICYANKTENIIHS